MVQENFLYHVDHFKKHVYQIFLIPKNASSSIKYSLNVENPISKHVPHGLLEEKPPQGRSLVFQNHTNNWEKHSSYKDYMYYRVVFARNPYERIYSSYRMFKTFKNNKEHKNSIKYWRHIQLVKDGHRRGSRKPWKMILPQSVPMEEKLQLLDGTFDDFVSCVHFAGMTHLYEADFWKKINDHLKPQYFFIFVVDNKINLA